MLAAGKDGGNVDPDAPETVWMPDANLRQAVRDRLGIEDDEALSKTQMTQLTGLRVHDTDIEALTGLEYATNLTMLSRRANSVRDVSPLKDLMALTDLWLSGNSISDVKALSNLTHLTRLYLAENPISDTSPLYPLLSANGGKITDIDRVVSE